MPRKGHKAEEARLDAALGLANAKPVTSWRPADLKEQRRLLARFAKSTEVAEFAPESFAALKERTEQVLDVFVRSGLVLFPLLTDDVPLVCEINAGGELRTLGPVSGGYVLALGMHLASPLGGRVRRCSAEDCRRYYLRHGRMEHCSRRCSRRLYMRQYRDRWTQSDRGR